jgi:hypothetical protein
MRQYFVIFITIALVVVALVAINAASYVEIEEAPDNEDNPDRSTYNARATGTRALFDYLQESGHRVVRWREPTDKLLSDLTARPETFVVAGPTRLPFSAEEVQDLLSWVRGGGRLILAERDPDLLLLPPSGDWRVILEIQTGPLQYSKPGNETDWTAGVSPVRPAQPTALTAGVDSVLPSQLASAIKVIAMERSGQGEGEGHKNEEEMEEDEVEEPPPPPAPVQQNSPGAKASPSASNTTAQQASLAPVLHLTDARGALLADYRYGAGRIIVLSDPFMLSNSGINRADNLRLAVNLVAGGSGGVIAFDEYHHGRAATQNQVLAYFAGTPVLAMLGQLGLLVLVVLFTSGSRFARALPLPFVDRRSKLEFVASMAELQQRSRAYDLAVENIYTRTRRVLARYGGLDGNAERALIAERVAARSGLNAGELEALMQECEDAMAGAPLNARQALGLVTRLREVERALGLRMRSREIKQAKDRG